jgi:ATP synthase protein I
MSDDPEGPRPGAEAGFLSEVSRKAERKLRAQRRGSQGVWLGLGVSGLIGWSVAIPTLGGALLGIWLDNHHPGKHSWTLMLIVAGLCLGCFSAWHWLAQQDRTMRDDAEAKDE